MLAGNVFHPGGSDLSLRTVDHMGLARGAPLLDIGCGVGQTAGIVAAKRHLSVIGIDASRPNLTRARLDPDASRVGFIQADVHRLPFVTGAFGGVLAECVLSLFADKAAALGEVRRVLWSGGRVGLTDVVLNSALPAEFAAAAADWACLSGALSREAYVDLFEGAGFEILGVHDESAGLDRLIGQIRRKLVVVGAGGLAAGRMPFDIATVRSWLDRFAREIGRGTIGYLEWQLRWQDHRSTMS